MTQVTYTTWARLEPRVSDPSLAPGVRAAVEDPLWLLGRQWQLGELDGEDAGSPIGIDVFGSCARIERLLLGDANTRNAVRAVDYDATVQPLEALVGREPAPDRRIVLAFRLDVAARVVRELRARSAARNSLATLRTAYPLDAKELADALKGSGPGEQARLELLAAALFDGVTLILAADADFGAATTGLASADQDAVQSVLDEARAEVDLAVLRAAGTRSAQPAAWHGETLGSSFALGVSAAGGSQVTLRAPDWDREQVDWWAFDASSEKALGATGSPARLAGVSGKPLSVLPGRLGFRGAPSVRYWEFEDRTVDLVSATAAPHEAALMAVLQFAFVYGGDWSSVPIEMPVGSRLTIDSVVVRDTFGVRVLVTHGGIDQAKSPSALTRLWFTTGDATGSLLLPPRLGPLLDGEPAEDVVLLRDEQANLAWAVELVAPDAAGHPVPWTALAPPPETPPDSSTDLPADRPTLRYRLASKVPPHWFPMVPEDAGDRLARYRVGVLPTGDSRPPLLPRSLFLRELAGSGLAEQELPRDGRRLRRRPLYARWVDGSTFTWIARDATTGRGEGSSGLVYDVLEPPSSA